jgi:hypothetical protein
MSLRTCCAIVRAGVSLYRRSEYIVGVRHEDIAQPCSRFSRSSFGNRRNLDSNIIAEVFAADGQHNGMAHSAVMVDRHAGFSAADIDQNSAQPFLSSPRTASPTAIGSSTVSSARRPQRFTAVTIVWVAVVELVTM